MLIGHSAGGHLVLWLSAVRRSPALHGALALAPAADLQLAHDLNLGDGAVALFLGAVPSTRKDVDPKQLPSPKTPTTILHGEKDVVVRLPVSESYSSDSSAGEAGASGGSRALRTDRSAQLDVAGW